MNAQEMTPMEAMEEIRGALKIRGYSLSPSAAERERQALAVLEAQLANSLTRDEERTIQKDLADKMDKIIKLETKLAIAKRAIENAPHSRTCSAPDFQCDCWKSKALAELEG